MSTPKSAVASMLEALPDDSGFEDIQYHLYVREKVKRGLEGNKPSPFGTRAHLQRSRGWRAAPGEGGF